MTGHPIPGPDPATETWREAVEKTTGAHLREALEANTALSMDHAKCLVELDRLRRELTEARHQWALDVDALIKFRREVDRQAREIERLTARVARQRGTYHLTDKARAALAANQTEEQP